MKHILSLFLYVLSGVFFLLFGPLILLIIFISPKRSHSIIIIWCKIMIFVFRCKINISGSFPENKTFVIMANHVSFLDVFAIPTVFKGKFSAIAASKNFKIPVYSTFLKKLKVVSIDRSNREQAIKGIKESEKLLKNGYHIVILPEGTRTKDGNLGVFKKGGFHLAVNTKAPILPIVTDGLFNIKPIIRWTINPGIINIKIGKPISSKHKTVDELLNETRNVFLNMKNVNQEN